MPPAPWTIKTSGVYGYKEDRSNARGNSLSDEARRLLANKELRREHHRRNQRVMDGGGVVVVGIAEEFLSPLAGIGEYATWQYEPRFTKCMRDPRRRQPPSTTIVQVVSLALPELLIEIEAIAVVG